ncbi:hypothetical protein HUJ04_000796 [Dendroctonus ponderosae]|nr:hypothetical protein HUJ04_000796 [Dendroctonus ponderosae]KAH1018661.1 hypothetical protein HUJ05_006389 [Dendroctonus ponderosae]
MKLFFLCLVFLVALIAFSEAAPAEPSLSSGSNAKSAFGQPFDEVVVESTLNVKRKVNSGSRQSRNGQDASDPLMQAQPHHQAVN